MCRVLYRSLEFTVELSLSFCFVPEAMKNSLVRLPPGFCWNHCRVFTVAEKLHLRVQLAPSWRFRTEGSAPPSLPSPLLGKREKQIRMMSLRSHGWGFQTRKLSEETPEDVGPSRGSRSAFLPSLPLTAVDTPSSLTGMTPTHSKSGPREIPAGLPIFFS